VKFAKSHNFGAAMKVRCQLYATGALTLAAKKLNAVLQFDEALRYEPEDRVFDSRWILWNFSST
jgi:hypothetical protein